MYKEWIPITIATLLVLYFGFSLAFVGYTYPGPEERECTSKGYTKAIGEYPTYRCISIEKRSVSTDFFYCEYPGLINGIIRTITLQDLYQNQKCYWIDANHAYPGI